MSIQFFPGHMHKARQQIAAVLGRVDVVLDLLDARVPRASANPMLEELRGGKPCLRLLNKQDLADPEVTADWLEHLNADSGTHALALSATDPPKTRAVVRACRQLAPARARRAQPVRALVVGVPNTGKSTLINTLARRRAARVGDEPGVTRCQQTVMVASGLLLYDTPGVLWPKLEDQRGAYCLAALGMVRDTAFDPIDVAVFAAELLLGSYSERLGARFKLDPLPRDGAALIEAVGRLRGCLAAGARVDLGRAGRLFLGELRSGRLGQVSLERPSVALNSAASGPAAAGAPR